MSQIKMMEQFCLIQLQVLSDRELRLRKDLQDCKIQREYLSHFLAGLHDEATFTQLHALIGADKMAEDE